MMDKQRFTDVPEFLADLDAGVFEQKIAMALSDIASGVVTNAKNGKLVVTFDFVQVANSSQVNITHSIVSTTPTGNGKVVDHNATNTPMHVGNGGKITLFPENQGQFFNKAGTGPFQESK